MAFNASEEVAKKRDKKLKQIEEAAAAEYQKQQKGTPDSGFVIVS